MSWLRRRNSEASTSEFVLSGYRIAAEYDQRQPSWEPATVHSELDAALLAAQQWRETAGPDSTVEIVRMVKNEGRVVRVVDAHGVERI